MPFFFFFFPVHSYYPSNFLGPKIQWRRLTFELFPDWSGKQSSTLVGNTAAVTRPTSALGILPTKSSFLVECVLSFMPSVLWAVLEQVLSQPLPWWISDSIVWQDQVGLIGYIGSKDSLSIVLLLISSRCVWMDKRGILSAILLEVRIKEIQSTWWS